MRIRCSVSGNKKCFSLTPQLLRGYGWDTPETSLFAQSLCNSILREIDALREIFKDATSTDEEFKRKSVSVERDVIRGRLGYINLDIYAERHKGKMVPYCKISIEDSECGVSTANILPEIARFLYKTVWLLKKTIPPSGMEILRSLNIIRDYLDPRKDTHELYLEDGTVKEREKTSKTKTIHC